MIAGHEENGCPGPAPLFRSSFLAPGAERRFEGRGEEMYLAISSGEIDERAAMMPGRNAWQESLRRRAISFFFFFGGIHVRPLLLLLATKQEPRSKMGARGGRSSDAAAPVLGALSRDVGKKRIRKGSLANLVNTRQ